MIKSTDQPKYYYANFKLLLNLHSLTTVRVVWHMDVPQFLWQACPRSEYGS